MNPQLAGSAHHYLRWQRKGLACIIIKACDSDLALCNDVLHLLQIPARLELQVCTDTPHKALSIIAMCAGPVNAVAYTHQPQTPSQAL